MLHGTCAYDPWQKSLQLERIATVQRQRFNALRVDHLPQRPADCIDLCDIRLNLNLIGDGSKFQCDLDRCTLIYLKGYAGLTVGSKTGRTGRYGVVSNWKSFEDEETGG